MSDIPDDIRCVASDIMDSACLGEHWANNGVDAALREAIARAILAERQSAYLNRHFRKEG